jgi:hypothetical protein
MMKHFVLISTSIYLVSFIKANTVRRFLRVYEFEDEIEYFLTLLEETSTGESMKRGISRDQRPYIFLDIGHYSYLLEVEKISFNHKMKKYSRC